MKYRLFIDDDQLPAIRDRFHHHPRFEPLRAYYDQYDFVEDRRYMAEEVQYNDQLFALKRLNTIVSECAFLYLMNGDPAVADHVKTAAGHIMKFERWDYLMDGDKTLGNLQAPHACVAIAIACDWLDDALDDTERRRWIATMGERGCLPCYRTLYCMKYPNSITQWHFDEESSYYQYRPINKTDVNRRAQITSDTNLRAIPASGLVIGAIACRRELGESEDIMQWLEMGIDSIQLFGDIYQPDGSYHEEINYGTHTINLISDAVTVLRRFDIADLSSLINWKGYCEFFLNYTMPTHEDTCDVVNFGDSGNKDNLNIQRAPFPFWAARETGCGNAQWVALNRALDKFWSVIWFDPSIEATPPPVGPRLWISELNRVVARTGWEADDLVVAMRSGPPGNHEHGDRNSIIVKAFGEKLIVDPLRPPYPYTDPDWLMRTTKGHSAVLIDGEGHEYINGVEGTCPSRAYARIRRRQSTDDYAYWESIGTQPYRLVNPEIREVIRSMVVLYASRTVIVIDTMEKWEAPSVLTARYFVNNVDDQGSLEITSDGFITRRPGGWLQARCLANVPFTSRRGRPFVTDTYMKPFPFADIDLEPAKAITLVTVLNSAPADADLPPVQLSRTDEHFQISDGYQSVTIEGNKVGITNKD